MAHHQHQLKQFMRECCIALMDAYNKAWTLPDVSNHEEAIRKAISMPAPRFWISTREAIRNITRMERGAEPYVRHGTNKYMALQELYLQYKELRARRFKSESITFVVTFACLRPAPRFYISYDRARRIIDKMRNGQYVV